MHISVISIGLFTINFSALWTEVTNLLITVAQVDQKTFWDIVYNEISKFHGTTGFFDIGFPETYDSKKPDQERLDHWNYYNLLVKTLIEVPHIVEQHSRQFVPFFLQFAESKYDDVLDNDLDNDCDKTLNCKNKEGETNIGEINNSNDNSNSNINIITN